MSKPRLSRRAFLRLSLASAYEIMFLGAGGSVYGFKVEPGWVDVSSVSLTLPSLASEFDGYRLAQISDIHMDDWMTRTRLAKIVELVNGQKPDLAAITGDFFTHEPEHFAKDMISALSELAPSDAVVAVLGNHDHWLDPTLVREVIRASGIIELSNAIHILRRGPAVLHIAGVDDVWEQQDRLDLVLEALPDTGAAILLAHEPDFADVSAATGRFDLQISGHSHGGQVIIPSRGAPILPRHAKKYPVGLYRVGDMLHYTNRGVGTVPPRVRFNCRPEVTVFTLKAKT